MIDSSFNQYFPGKGEGITSPIQKKISYYVRCRKGKYEIVIRLGEYREALRLTMVIIFYENSGLLKGKQ